MVALLGRASTTSTKLVTCLLVLLSTSVCAALSAQNPVTGIFSAAWSSASQANETSGAIRHDPSAVRARRLEGSDDESYEDGSAYDDDYWQGDDSGSHNGKSKSFGGYAGGDDYPSHASSKGHSSTDRPTSRSAYTKKWSSSAVAQKTAGAISQYSAPVAAVTQPPVADGTATATLPILQTWSSSDSTWAVTQGWTTVTQESTPAASGIGPQLPSATPAPWSARKSLSVALAVQSASNMAVQAASTAVASSPYSWTAPTPGQVFSGEDDVALQWQSEHKPSNVQMRLCLLEASNATSDSDTDANDSCGTTTSAAAATSGGSNWMITFPAPNVTAANAFYVALSFGNATSSSWRRSSGEVGELSSPAFVLAPYGTNITTAGIRAAISAPVRSAAAGPLDTPARPLSKLAIALPLTLLSAALLVFIAVFLYRRGGRGSSLEKEQRRLEEAHSVLAARQERDMLGKEVRDMMRLKWETSSSFDDTSTRQRPFASSSSASSFSSQVQAPRPLTAVMPQPSTADHHTPVPPLASVPLERAYTSLSSNSSNGTSFVSCHFVPEDFASPPYRPCCSASACGSTSSLPVPAALRPSHNPPSQATVIATAILQSSPTFLPLQCPPTRHGATGSSTSPSILRAASPAQVGYSLPALPSPFDLPLSSPRLTSPTADIAVTDGSSAPLVPEVATGDRAAVTAEEPSVPAPRELPPPALQEPPPPALPLPDGPSLPSPCPTRSRSTRTVRSSSASFVEPSLTTGLRGSPAGQLPSHIQQTNDFVVTELYSRLRAALVGST